MADSSDGTGDAILSLGAALNERFKRCLQVQVSSVWSQGAAVVCSDRIYGGDLSVVSPMHYMPLLYQHGFRCELGHDELGGLSLRIWRQTYLQRKRIDTGVAARKTTKA